MNEEKNPSKNDLAEVKDEFIDKATSGTAGLEHIETEIRTSERKAVMRCDKCGVEQDMPVHCGEPMNLEETGFVCSDCSEKVPLPVHCDEPMKLVIK